MNVDRTIKLKLDLSECVKCGFQIHADLNAARNIAILGKSGDSRRTVTSPYIACDDAEARKGIYAEHSYNAPQLRAYPSRPVARHVIIPHAKCNMAM